MRHALNRECILIGILVLVSAAAPAAGADGGGSAAPAEPCPICEAKDRFNKLIDGVKWGADLRLRAIYDNNLGLDKHAAGHERFWQRYRARVWTSVSRIDNLHFNIRLVTEPRYFCRPGTMEEQLIRHEGIFDQFNVAWNKAFGLPLKLTIGRQDIKLGDGWLVGDGTQQGVPLFLLVQELRNCKLAA